jgi:MinD superfamily P-loop ATPase
VTEPTPFGLHDLQGCVAVLRELAIPCGVVVNRDGTGYTGVEDFCKEARIPILLRIPDDRCIAEAYARGEPLVTVRPEYVGLLLGLLREVARQIGKTVVARESRTARTGR